MLQPVSNQSPARRRFGLIEALLVVAILLFGGFALVTEGRQSVGSLLAGYDEAMGR